MPPLRRLEQAGRSLRRAGERAPRVAEQLALEQRLRDRAAVDGDERPAARVDSSWMSRAIRSLPDAALAGDEHGGVDLGHPPRQVHQLPHREAPRDDPQRLLGVPGGLGQRSLVLPLGHLGRVLRLLQRVFERLLCRALRHDLAVELPRLEVKQAHLEHVVDARQHLGEIERLADEVLRAGLERAQLVVRLRGDDQHRQIAVRLDLLQAFHHLEAVHARHLEIEQDQVVAVLAVQLADLARVGGRRDAV